MTPRRDASYATLLMDFLNEYVPPRSHMEATDKIAALVIAALQEGIKETVG